jgi:hypothetical protein
LPAEIWHVEINLSLAEMAVEDIAMQISDVGIFIGD